FRSLRRTCWTSHQGDKAAIGARAHRGSDGCERLLSLRAVVAFGSNPLDENSFKAECPGGGVWSEAEVFPFPAEEQGIGDAGAAVKTGRLPRSERAFRSDPPGRLAQV